MAVPRVMASRITRGAVASGLVVVMALGGCGTVYLPGSNHRSAVLLRIPDVRQPDADSPFGRPYPTAEARLQAAAFTLLRGKSGAEAEAFLLADGWACQELVCSTGTALQEWFIVGGVRAPGPPRRYLATYQLTLPDRVIATPADLVAAVESRSEDV